MAKATHMPRRGFLKAIPATAAALAVPAAAQGAPSPIVAKVREWQGHHDWIEHTPMTEADCDAHCDRARVLEDQVMDMEITGPVDLLAVLYMLTQSGTYLRGTYRNIDQVVDQMKAAIGV